MATLKRFNDMLNEGKDPGKKLLKNLWELHISKFLDRANGLVDAGDITSATLDEFLTDPRTIETFDYMCSMSGYLGKLFNKKDKKGKKKTKKDISLSDILDQDGGCGTSYTGSSPYERTRPIC